MIKMPKKLKDAPGIVPAMDMPLGRALIEMDKLKELKDEITGFKIGSEIRDMNGYPTMRRLFDDIGIEIPTIMDGQKDGTDIPDLITGQVERAAKIGRFDAYIGSPLGSGSNIGSEKKGSLEAFVDACYEQEIVPIIVLEMTQPGSTRYSDLEKCELLARDAKDLGVMYFVAPANRPERLKVYKRIIGDGEIISPGSGPQKTGNVIEDATNAVKYGADHLVIGRGIFKSENPKQKTEEIYEKISEAYEKR